MHFANTILLLQMLHPKTFKTSFSLILTGRYRLLMRREQVLKICCNHLLGPEIVLRPMANSDKAWVWHALDASEDEVLARDDRSIEIASPHV